MLIEWGPSRHYLVRDRIEDITPQKVRGSCSENFIYHSLQFLSFGMATATFVKQSNNIFQVNGSILKAIFAIYLIEMIKKRVVKDIWLKIKEIGLEFQITVILIQNNFIKLYVTHVSNYFNKSHLIIPTWILKIVTAWF